MDPTLLLHTLWKKAHGNDSALQDIRIERPDAHLPSVFPVGALAAATVGAQALAAAMIARRRGIARQTVTVDARRALALFRSERYLSINGQPLPSPWDPIAGHYQAGDGRWIQLHTNFPHHRDGVLRVLECDNTREAVARAISRWQAETLDERLAREGLCAALVRRPDEWLAHPQARALAGLPLFDIVRIGDAPPRPFTPIAAGGQPLAGLRVLDLSRIIAAPVAARTLAQHGAQVLAIGARHLPNIEPLLIDTGRGKRSAFLDLRHAGERDTLMALVSGADVFLQAYRPGALAACGLTPEALCEARPGLIHVTLSAYGHAGPWAQRRGFDSLVQSASGIAWEEGHAAGSAQPGKLPCQALDHATGYLAAFATLMALQRRAEEGGSWLVRVSLAQTGRWLQSLPRVADGLAAPDLTPDEIRPWLHTLASPFGEITAMAPAEAMPATPPRYSLPPVPPGTHAPAWSDE